MNGDKAMTKTEWYQWQKEVLNSEDYTEVIKRARQNAQRLFDHTSKESLVKVAVKNEDLRSR